VLRIVIINLTLLITSFCWRSFLRRVSVTAESDVLGNKIVQLTAEIEELHVRFTEFEHEKQSELMRVRLEVIHIALKQLTLAGLLSS